MGTSACWYIEEIGITGGKYNAKVKNKPLSSKAF